MKIFLPNSVFKTKQNCDLYGDIGYGNENRTTSYFVVEALNAKPEKRDDGFNNLRFVGCVADSKIKHCSGPLNFRYDENTEHIYLGPTESVNIANANLFLYEPTEFMQIAEPIDKPLDDINILRQLLHNSHYKKQHLAGETFSFNTTITSVLNLPLRLMTQLFIYSMECWVVRNLLSKTTFYEHYNEWRKFYKSGKRDWNIVLDKILGLLVMLILLFYIQDPSNYVIQTSHLVIDELRLLLRSLKGSPIGLKLNVHLNNFFLDCFSYQIDLWATFLSIIEPTVQQLFMPITLIGSMGLSCQLALFADLISIVILHAHCFYIYTAALYKVEIRGLSVLWKVVRGKRFNLLKKRVESHNYNNRQLYLATIFFTTMLFLFPTILVYYVVFTTLRLIALSALWLLKTLRRRILEFPLQDLYEWSMDNFRDRDSIHIEYFTSMPILSQTEDGPKNRMFVFKINIHSSSLDRVFSSESGVLKELTTNEDLKLKDIFKHILEGKF